MPSPPPMRRRPISSAPPRLRSPSSRPELRMLADIVPPTLNPLSTRTVMRRALSGARLLGSLAACSSGKPAPATATGATANGAAAIAPGPASHASAFMLTEDQRARIHTEVVAPSAFQPAVVTTGTVAFNGDRSTPVLSQISGPVARILVNTGTHVEPGTPLALVSSPDFAQAIAAYQKAQAALQNTARIATLDEQLFKNDAIARTDLDQARSDSASAAADREAAIQQMVAL